MKVKNHCTMLSKQFLLSTTRPTHPNHSDINHVAKCLMKNTLVSEFSTDLKNTVPEGISDDLNHKEGLKTIHLTSVQSAIHDLGNNEILGTTAPRINASEKTLPRKTRSSLAQLR